MHPVPHPSSLTVPALQLLWRKEKSPNQRGAERLSVPTNTARTFLDTPPTSRSTSRCNQLLAVGIMKIGNFGELS